MDPACSAMAQIFPCQKNFKKFLNDSEAARPIEVDGTAPHQEKGDLQAHTRSRLKLAHTLWWKRRGEIRREEPMSA